MDEVWKKIPGIPQNYEVSNFGNVRKELIGSEYKELHKTKVAGYYVVSFEGRQFGVHTLVAKAFLPNPDGKNIVIHKDGDKLNNRLDNLMWEFQRNRIKSRYKDSTAKGKYLIRIVDTDIVFNTMKSAELFTGLPAVCIKDSMENGNQNFGYQFAHEESNDGKHVYIDIDDYMEFGKTSTNIDEFREKIIHNL